MIKVLGVAHLYRFAMSNAPEPESWCSQVITQKDAFFSLIVMCGIADVRMFSWKVPRDVRAEDMPVPFEIVAQGVWPKIVQFLPGSSTICIGPMGVRAEPVEEGVGPESPW